MGTRRQGDLGTGRNGDLGTSKLRDMVSRDVERHCQKDITIFTLLSENEMLEVLKIFQGLLV